MHENIPNMQHNKGEDCMKYEKNCSRNRYKINKHVNANVILTKIQCKNKPFIGKTYDKIPEMNYNQQLDCITYINITIQTPL